MAWHGSTHDEHVAEGNRTEETAMKNHDNLTDAHRYRLLQAEDMLRAAGFVQASDGTWHPTEEQARAR